MVQKSLSISDFFIFTQKQSQMKGNERCYVMLNREEKRLITENEIKPNYYAANAMLGVAVALLMAFVLNELNIYDVSKILMRICFLISMILLMIPQIIVHKKKMLVHAASKYVIMTIIMLLTLIITIILNIHVTLIYILPMLLASQYRSYRIFRIAFWGSFVCCIISPILAYLLGTWSLDYLSGYIETLCSVTIITSNKESSNIVLDIGKIALYMILPQLLFLSAYGAIMYSVTKKGIENLRDQLQIIHMSEFDSLTGLLNRNSYEANHSAYSTACKVSITCIFADVNGLHELNNSLGHTAGDKMLQSVAEALKEKFGAEDTFRIGGDEFLAFAKDLDQHEVEERVSWIKKTTLQQGYQVSIGVAQAPASDDMHQLVKAAEQRMYEDKERYYSEEGSNRNKRNQ